jgi:opacity protein-like surface antigen
MNKKSTLLTLLVTLIFLFSAGDLAAINSKAGTAAYSFLKIGVGARAVALGNAYVAMANDESAIYYNPAGLRQIQGKALSSSYHNYVADIQGGYLSAVIPWGEKRKLGFAINYLSYGSIPLTDIGGNVNGDFGGGDLAVSIAYAQPISAQLDFGLATKFIYESIDTFSSTGLALDLGLLYHLKDGHTRIGLTASNLGFQLSGLAEEHKDPLPIMIKAGVAHRMHNAPFVVVADGGKYTDNSFFVGGGVEYVGLEMMKLRAGYNTIGTDYKTGGDKENLAGLSFGIGFLLDKLTFDYAYVPYADLGNSHRIYIARRW